LSFLIKPIRPPSTPVSWFPHSIPSRFSDLNANWRAPIAVSVGAIGGALSRYYLTLWCTTRWGIGFPATFTINLTGCFLMGWIATLALPPSNWSAELRLLLTTGFLGAYTTFSTYGLDSLNLLKQHNLTIAGLYWLGSSLLGLVAVQIGVWLGEWMRR
jgi:fluoride exporter